MLVQSGTHLIYIYIQYLIIQDRKGETFLYLMSTFLRFLQGSGRCHGLRERYNCLLTLLHLPQHLVPPPPMTAAVLLDDGGGGSTVSA